MNTDPSSSQSDFSDPEAIYRAHIREKLQREAASQKRKRLAISGAIVIFGVLAFAIWRTSLAVVNQELTPDSARAIIVQYGVDENVVGACSPAVPEGDDLLDASSAISLLEGLGVRRHADTINIDPVTLAKGTMTCMVRCKATATLDFPSPDIDGLTTLWTVRVSSVSVAAAGAEIGVVFQAVAAPNKSLTAADPTGALAMLC